MTNRKNLFTGAVILVAIVVAAIYWGYPHFQEETTKKEVVISNSRVEAERQMKADPNRQEFVTRVTTLVAKEALPYYDESTMEHIDKGARILADSVGTDLCTRMADSWQKGNGDKREFTLLMSILSEQTDASAIKSKARDPQEPYSPAQLPAEDYELIFSKWKVLQPDNPLLKVLPLTSQHPI